VNATEVRRALARSFTGGATDDHAWRGSVGIGEAEVSVDVLTGADGRPYVHVASPVTSADRPAPRVARLLVIENGELVLGRFAHIVEAEVRAHGAADPFYRDIDPEVFGRAVVGAVYEATSHFLVDPDVDLEALIRGLCAIFAPET